MARPPATPEQRREQRQKIRQAAVDLYAEEGPSGISARAVAAKAGVSQGTIYRYYASLGELMRSLWVEPLREANQRLEKTAGEIDDPVERIRALLLGYLEFALDQPEVYRGGPMYVRPQSAPNPDQHSPERAPLYRLMVEAIDEGRAQGRIDVADSGRTVELLWAGLHGAIALPINADIYELTPAASTGPEMIDLLVNALFD